ncbi:MAG: aspartate aminotransferase family protein [Candidatus Poribacteria bacterium]|nr:aspartate aminotransferase family protein [Candidatus Poribacteria bacterium]
MTITSPVQIENEPQSNESRRLAAEFISKGHKTYTPTQLVIQHAQGVYLWNPEERRFIDFTSGVLVANLGHDHPYFEERYRRYVKGLPRTAYNTLTELEVRAARRLIENLDNEKMQCVLWADSGATGVIKAIQAAQRHQPDKHIILATRSGFHSTKGLAGNVTGEQSRNPNVRWLSFPMVMDKGQASNLEWSPAVLIPKVVAELDALKREYPDQICMLITEPYLGARGAFHPPKSYLRQLNDWCNENGVTFILDEVQSCHGRTGSMYAFQTYGLDPDLVVLGKGLGNGEPVTAVAGRADILDALDYGEAHDSYSGNPRACAAILAVLDTFEKCPILENCRQMSAIIEEGLYRLTADFEFATYVRGEGLVWGLEVDSYGGKTAGEIANECVLECYRHGLHLMAPLAGNVLRIAPPLVITESEAKAGLQLMYQAFEQIAKMGKTQE